MAPKLRISVGCRVVGSFGPFLSNPRGFKRRIRQRVFGTVIQAISNGKFKVLFDFDGRKQSCSSKKLTVVDANAGIPLQELQVQDQDQQTQQLQQEQQQEEVQDVINEPSVMDASNEKEEDFFGVEEDEEDEVQTPNNDFCFTQEDFIRGRDEMNLATQHMSRQRVAWEQIRLMEGEEYVSSSSNDGEIKWRVVRESTYDEMGDIIAKEIDHLKRNPPLKDVSMLDSLNALFWYLYPGDVDEDVRYLNGCLVAVNEERKKHLNRVIKDVSHDILVLF